jgi:hypothetical protein
VLGLIDSITEVVVEAPTLPAISRFLYASTFPAMAETLRFMFSIFPGSSTVLLPSSWPAMQRAILVI